MGSVHYLETWCYWLQHTIALSLSKTSVLSLQNKYLIIMTMSWKPNIFPRHRYTLFPAVFPLPPPCWDLPWNLIIPNSRYLIKCGYLEDMFQGTLSSSLPHPSKCPRDFAKIVTFQEISKIQAFLIAFCTYHFRNWFWFQVAFSSIRLFQWMPGVSSTC